MGWLLLAVLEEPTRNPTIHSLCSALQDKLVTLMVANHVLWPVTRFLNDQFVPEKHRQVGNHIITVSPPYLFHDLVHTCPPPAFADV